MEHIACDNGDGPGQDTLEKELGLRPRRCGQLSVSVVNSIYPLILLIANSVVSEAILLDLFWATPLGEMLQLALNRVCPTSIGSSKSRSPLHTAQVYLRGHTGRWTGRVASGIHLSRAFQNKRRVDIIPSHQTGMPILTQGQRKSTFSPFSFPSLPLLGHFSVPKRFSFGSKLG